MATIPSWPGTPGDDTSAPIRGGVRFVPETGEPVEFLSVESFVPDSATLVATQDPETVKLALMHDVAFDRPFDIFGIAPPAGARASGTPLGDIADLFTASGEFAERFGADLDPGEFFDVLCETAFHREADDLGRTFWVNALRSGEIDEGDAIPFFAWSGEVCWETS